MFRKRSGHFSFEPLESRQLMAADVSLKGDVLSIRGTGRDDQIEVQRVASGPDAGMVQVSLNGTQKLFNDNYTGSGTGSISRLVIRGSGGNDQITIAGNIYIPAAISGGRGNDTIQGGAGDDTIIGGRGLDTVLGGDGSDHIDGGRGNDQIEAGGGADTCFGGNGNDSIVGNEDDDLLDGGKGNDHLESGEGDDTCLGGKGDDQIFGGRGKDELNGNIGNDELYGELGKDVLFGELGNDFLDGGDGADFLDAGIGDDNLRGGTGDDELKGGIGIDSLDGEDGNNLLDTEGEGEVDTLVNGIPVDLDRQFYVDFTTAGPGSLAKFDLQNKNGQVVERLTVEAHGLAGQPGFDLLVDGLTAVNVPLNSNGDGLIVYSSDPTGTEMPFPLNSAPIGSGVSVSSSTGLQGTVIRRFVI